MKVVACYQAFNEEDYLEQSIMSIYPFVDKIYVYEPCYKTMLSILKEDRCTKNYKSGDNTANIINKFAGKSNKVIYIPLGIINYDETQTYQRILNEVDIGDYIWLIGADEIYDPDMCYKIRKLIDSKKYSAFWFYHLLFWHDFNHIRIGGKNHLMLYKKVADTMFYSPRHMDVQWKDTNMNLYGFQKNPQFNYECHYNGQKFISYLPEAKDIYYYHYAYVRNYQRLLEKIMWQYYMMVASEQNDEYRHSLNYESPLKFKLDTFQWFTNGDSHLVKRYNHKHPKIMRDHKYANIRWDEQPIELSYEEAISLVNDYKFSEFKVTSNGEIEYES